MSGGDTNSTSIGDEGVIATIGGVPSTGANVPPDVGVLDEPDTDAMPLVRPSEPDVGRAGPEGVRWVRPHRAPKNRGLPSHWTLAFFLLNLSSLDTNT